jgi:exonuclease III
MDMRFGTWNVRSIYKAASLREVVEEISKYKLDLVRVQEVRWDGGGTEPAGEYTFLHGKWNENHELGIKTKLNSVALVRKLAIPTKRPPLVGEVSANFCG